MKAKEELIRKLCARWSAPSPEMAIGEALRVAFPRLAECTLPIRLSQLAPLRKVTDISKKVLACDGIISIGSSGSYLIEVNQDHPETRRRFTIAHELGHTFFFDVDGEIRQRVRDVNLDNVNRYDVEETLCNYAAASILMPSTQFDSVVRRVGPSSEGLIEMARSFNVSVQAISKRLLQRFGLKVVVVMWEYNQDKKSYESKWLTSFSPSTQPSRARFVIGHRDPAFKFVHEQDAYRGQIWISLGGPMDAYYVDAVAWSQRERRRLLTVFVLDRKPETAFKTRVLPRYPETQLRLF